MHTHVSYTYMYTHWDSISGMHVLCIHDICVYVCFFVRVCIYTCTNTNEFSRRESETKTHKNTDQAVFRGSTTGGVWTLKNWRGKPRSKVVAASIARPDLLDAKFLQLVQYEESDKEGLIEIFKTEGLLGARKVGGGWGGVLGL